jgi:hypothetical protein
VAAGAAVAAEGEVAAVEGAAAGSKG